MCVRACVRAEDVVVQFPDCETIRRRVSSFQRRFIEHLMTIYSSLPASVQTSALSVAVLRRSSHHGDTSPDMVVSLHQYLSAAASCTDVSLQLPASEYALTVSRENFHLIQRARLDGCDDPAALARTIVEDVATEAAAELGRAFEYQLVLLGDDDGLAARLVAQRAAQRAMEYLKRTSRHVDVNSLVRGVVEGRPLDAPATVSVILGPRCELRWNVDDMFQRHGLRRERLLVAGAVESVGGYGTPWRFYASTSHDTDATLYGYRSQLLARDFHSEWIRGGRQPSYRLDANEEAAYSIEVPWRSDDFHRTYRPYRRLVGSAVLARYAACSREDQPNPSLDEFVQRLQGDVFRRDEIEPVFRPLTSALYPEGVDLRVDDPSRNPADNLDPNPLTRCGFCYDETERKSSLIQENNCNRLPESDLVNCREEYAPEHSSALYNDSPACQSVELGRDGSTGVDEVQVSPDMLHKEVSVSGTTNSTTEAHYHAANQSRNSHPADTSPARWTTAGKGRAPPPAVKPKPSSELRRRLSTPATSMDSSNSMTSLPVTHRRLVSVDGSDSMPEVTVRFPTLEELFGRELAAIRQASAFLCEDTASTEVSANTGSTTMTSLAKYNDVITVDNSSQPTDI